MPTFFCVRKYDSLGRVATLTHNSGKANNYSYTGDGQLYQVRSSDGTRILADYWGSNSLLFAYDENNRPISFTYNGTQYFYITNLQSDVMEIRNSANTKVATYVDNAFSKLESSSGTI